MSLLNEGAHADAPAPHVGYAGYVGDVGGAARTVGRARDEDDGKFDAGGKQRGPGPVMPVCLNCCMNCWLTALLACQCCSLDKLASQFAFVPPVPPTYLLKKAKGESPSGAAHEAPWSYRLELQDDLKHDATFRRALKQVEVMLCPKPNGDAIPMLRASPSLVTPAKATGRGSLQALTGALGPDCLTPRTPWALLFAHGNAADLGMGSLMAWQLAENLRMRVYMFDYSGYGAVYPDVDSRGVASGHCAPSIRKCCEDAEAAFEAVLQDGIRPEHCVLYGQSVGTAICAWLAKKRTVGGVILHSPLQSGLAVLDPYPTHCCKPSCVLSPMDVLRTRRWLMDVELPVLVIHGLCDEVIPFSHAEAVYNALRSKKKDHYWVEEAGHNDLIETAGPHFFERLRQFLIQSYGRAPPPQLEMNVTGC